MNKILLFLILSFVGIQASALETKTNYFITNWKTNNLEITKATSITLPISGMGYGYDVGNTVFPIMYVKQGGTGDGSSWATAMGDLQMAINTPGVDLVFVAKGTYQPAVNSAFVMRFNVRIYGGFNDTGNPGMTDRDWHAYPTILKGNGSRVIRNEDLGGIGTLAYTVLDGFTITEGNNVTTGAGIYNLRSSPTLTNLIISGNSATSEGGGIYNYSSSPNLSNMTISGNLANGSGGGIYNTLDSSPSLTNVIISGNSSNGSGGGMYNFRSAPSLINVTISGNSAYNGGGIYNEAFSPTLTNVTISGNTATNSGGEWYNMSGYPVIRNSIIYGNGIGGTLYNNENSILQGYTSTTNGNINYTGSLAYLFTDAANGDYSLKVTSPAINTGNNDHYPGLNADTKDLAGNPRLYNGNPYPNVIDMGAYEFQGDPDLIMTYFITKWKTDNLSTESSNATSITIPTTGTGYNYDVSWKNDGIWENGITGSKTHDYGTAGTYEVAIRGTFPRIYFNNVGDKQKIISIDQWGTTAWSSMENAFKGCKNLNGNGLDAPMLSGVTNMAFMFDGAEKFNLNIGNWNVSNVTDMSFMFRGASLFNQDIGGWNVSNVTTMSRMFYTASGFNQDISGWNVGNVTDMHAMFAYASLFNQNIGSWNVGNVTTMHSMFISASAFDQNLGGWDVSNVSIMTNMFNSNSLSMANYDALLNGWNTLTLQSGVTFSGGDSKYCDGTTARAIIIGTSGWTITDGGQAEACKTTPDTNNILYVNKNVSAGNSRGNSWTNAIPELADALKYAYIENARTSYTAANPLKIYVAGGTYKPLYSPEYGANFGTDQGRNNSFLMINNVQLYGGFDPVNNITDLTHTRLLPSFGGAGGGTILSGDVNGDDIISGSGSTLSITNNAENSLHVIMSFGQVGEALLDGFVVTGGNANSTTRLIINTIQMATEKSGGGMYNQTSSPSIVNVYFNGNSANNGGGGMYNSNSSPSLTNVAISGNSANNSGGGIYNFNSSSPALTNVNLSGNFATSRGGGLFNFNSSPTLTNVTINGNLASQGGEWFNDSGTPIIRNSIIYGNGIAGTLSNTESSILQGHTDTTNGNITYTGSIADLFTDAANGDYSLKATSPAVNAGNNSHYPGLNSNTKDLKGNPRLYESTIDMGAYEFQGAPLIYFITKWKTDNLSTNSSNATSITIPTTGTGYNYAVSWKNDGMWENGFTGDATHEYRTAGTYTIAIRGDFPQIHFNNSGDKEKIISIDQWGTIAWRSMENAFKGCKNLNGNATDAPILSGVTNMAYMFDGASKFDQNIDNWNMTNVTDMSYMFQRASLFNQNIGSWNVANVTNMNSMFAYASSFDQNIGSWNVGNVTDMTNMFNYYSNILSVANYDALLNGWNSLTLQNGVTFNVGSSKYCDGTVARNNIITTFGWIITDAGKTETCTTPDANNILYVNKHASSGNGHGNSWANALPQLTDALGYADQQDNYTSANPLKIYVAIGTYTPGENRDYTFLMVKNVQLYGGFDPDNGITDLTQARILPSLEVPTAGTILDGNNVNNHVVLSVGLVETALLDGFTITGGKAFFNPEQEDYDDIIVKGESIYKRFGGGMYNKDSSPRLTNMIINGNFAIYYGGGMHNDNSSPRLTNVTISGNSANFYGGGVSNDNSSPRLTNVTISGNSANYSGGEWNNISGIPIIRNSIIYGNGINGTLYDNQNSILQGHTDTTNGNINYTGSVTDLFTDAANGDYSLKASSVAVNTGSNTAYTTAGGNLATDLDLAGNPRLYNGIPNPDVIDMGAYEFQGEPVTDYIWENNDWTPRDPSGVATANDNILVVNGSTVLTANTDINNITINAGAILNIERVLFLNGNITNNGDLVFLSDDEKNGELAAVPVTSIITGDATVQRYMMDRRAYRMVTSAVTTGNSIHANWQEDAEGALDNPNEGFGTHITGSTSGADGFDATATGNASMFYVPNGTQQFEVIANTDQTNLTAGEAYLMFVRGDRGINLSVNDSHSETILRATGSLVTGDVIQNFAASSGGERHFVMFGNPYQSAVDMKTVLTNSTNVNANQFYLMDPNLGDYGIFRTVELDEQLSPDQYLQPGQAAQVEVNFGTAAIVVFRETDKAPGNFTSTNRNTASGNDKLVVQLYTTENFNNGGPLHDSFLMRFADGNDNGLTPKDAVKPMNFYENLGINHDGTYLSIERREMPQSGEVYPLYSAGYSYTDYTLKMIVDGLDTTFFYLDDHFTGTSTLFEAGVTTYSFSIDANDPLSKATDRFSIRTEERLGVDDNNLLSGIRLYPNPLDGNTFYINAPKLNGEQLLVSIYDLTGRRIFKQNLECQANTVTIPMGNDVASGVYLVTLRHNGEEQTYRLIKE